MIRPPLRKLHHYELHTTRSRRCNAKHCGRGAGTIESRGCNTFHGGINARGTLWIHADRDRETRSSIPSAILAISEVDCVTSRSTIQPARLVVPQPPILRRHRPRTIARGQKINASLQLAFHQLRGSRFSENMDGLIRQPSGDRY